MSIRRQSAQWHIGVAAPIAGTRRPCMRPSEGPSSYPAPSDRLRGGQLLDAFDADKVNRAKGFDTTELTS
jgi:hypothetical protein